MRVLFTLLLLWGFCLLCCFCFFFFLLLLYLTALKRFIIVVLCMLLNLLHFHYLCSWVSLPNNCLLYYFVAVKHKGPITFPFRSSFFFLVFSFFFSFSSWMSYLFVLWLRFFSILLVGLFWLQIFFKVVGQRCFCSHTHI